MTHHPLLIDWQQRISRGETSEPKFLQGLQLLNLHLEKFPEKHRALLLEPTSEDQS